MQKNTSFWRKMFLNIYIFYSIGHTFLLIWNNLFIVEEGKAYLGWERIKDMLRNEEHKRLSTDLINPAGDSDSRTALSKLKVYFLW